MNKVQNTRTSAPSRPRTADRLRRGELAARRILRGLVATITTPAPRATVAPAAVPAVAEQPVPDPAGLFTADEIPPLADIDAAAAKFLDATEQARTADRAKRASRKLLDRLPAGQYGPWKIERVATAREVADLDAIRAIFAANGLGEVPMKPCAPSLKVGIAPELAEVASLIAAGGVA